MQTDAWYRMTRDLMTDIPSPNKEIQKIKSAARNEVQSLESSISTGKSERSPVPPKSADSLSRIKALTSSDESKASR